MNVFVRGCAHWILVVLIPALCGQAVAASEHAFSEHWAGTTILRGHDVLVEVEISASADHERGPSAGHFSAFGRAPLGFEFPFLRDARLSSSKHGGHGWTFTVQSRGGAIEAKLKLSGDFASGRLSASDKSAPVPIQLRRLAPSPDAGGKSLWGLYADRKGAYLVTAREFGGLRLIDGRTGANESLFAVAPREFVPGSALRRGNASRTRLTFRKDAKGAKLVLRQRTASRVLMRKAGIRQRSLSFSSQGLTLRGTLLVPEGEGPFPGLVLVHGSGPIYRTALIQRALAFAQMGVAVLVYDKRGSGQSEGNWRTASFDDLAMDAEAALAALERQPEIDATATGYQGHSQAGYVVPLAVNRSDRADFAIIVNGGSVSPGEQSLFDKRNDLIRKGFPPRERKAALALLARIQAYMRDGAGDYEALNSDYLAAQNERWFSVLDLPALSALPHRDDPSRTVVEYRQELSFDPLSNQRRITIPVLVILGGADETVPADIAAAGWRSSMVANPGFRLRIIPKAGHGMRGPDGALLPEYLDAHRAWLKKVAFPKR